MRELIKSSLKRIIIGPPPDPRVEWPRILQGRVTIGSGTRLVGATLSARDPNECRLSIGMQSNVESSIVFEKSSASVVIGSRTHVGGGTVLSSACNIHIGDDVLVAFDVLIADHNSHSVRFQERKHDVRDWLADQKDWSHVEMAPVTISDKSWIGARAIILKGVTIGVGAIVGAGSVVTRTVPPWTIVAGNPARPVKTLIEEQGID